ncbi:MULTISPECIES: hypothetical protein [unclassified Microbulbifer]|nr:MULTISPECIES: hypothetical protein [unclassified Microbulbifer]
MPIQTVVHTLAGYPVVHNQAGDSGETGYVDGKTIWHHLLEN